jgi:hypothetical protein
MSDFRIGFIEKFFTGDLSASDTWLGFDRVLAWILALGVMLWTKGFTLEVVGIMIDLFDRSSLSFFFGSYLDELSRVGKFDEDLFSVV